MRDAQSAAEELDRGLGEAAPTIVAQADAPPSGAANTPPEAESMCIVTAEDATLSFEVMAKDADGDPLSVSASQPQSGRTEVGPDGTLVFVADEPGLQTFQYAVQDGRGGSDSADATVFVNPLEDALIPPAMARIAPADLPAIAQACATGIALETTPLSGPEIQIQDPAPGQRFQIQAEPGQQIQLQSRDFVDATWLVVDGGLLIVTPDGNMAYVADFVANAEGGAAAHPVGLRGAGGRRRRAAREPAADHLDHRRPAGAAARGRPRARRRRRLQPVRSRRHRHRPRSARPAAADSARARRAAGAVRKRDQRRRRRQPAAYAHARPWPGRAGRRGDRDAGVHLRAAVPGADRAPGARRLERSTASTRATSRSAPRPTPGSPSSTRSRSSRTRWAST